MRDLRGAVAAWWSFRGSGAGTMAFLAGRMAILPLGGLDAELRALRGRILSLGAGHGLAERYLATINPDVVVDGVELDERRVRVAEITAGRCPRVTVRTQDVTSLDETQRFTGAIAIDVFHHVPLSGHRSIAKALYDALLPSGRCIVKDIATTPRWKHAFNRLHDRIVTGGWVDSARGPDEMAEIFTGVGFVPTDVRRISRLGPYPHYVLALQRPD